MISSRFAYLPAGRTGRGRAAQLIRGAYPIDLVMCLRNPTAFEFLHDFLAAAAAALFGYWKSAEAETMAPDQTGMRSSASSPKRRHRHGGIP